MFLRNKKKVGPNTFYIRQNTKLFHAVREIVQIGLSHIFYVEVLKQFKRRPAVC